MTEVVIVHEPAPEPISIKYQPPPPGGNDKGLRVIKNPFPPFEGYITDDLTLSPTKSEQCECTVYHYASWPVNPNGTYVVVQFEQSTRYLYAKTPDDLWVQKGKYWKTDAKDINTTDDSRVFLVKRPGNGGTEFMFASCVASQQQPGNKSKARVITVVWDQTNKKFDHVELRPDRQDTTVEGKGKRPPLDTQLFDVMKYQLSDHHWGKGRLQEWVRVQHPLKPPENVDEESSAMTSVGQSPKKSKTKFFSK